MLITIIILAALNLALTVSLLVITTAFPMKYSWTSDDVDIIRPVYQKAKGSKAYTNRKQNKQKGN